MSDWIFKQKLYPHFDKVLSKKEAIELTKNPKAVASHSFLPFIEKKQKYRRFKKYLKAKQSQENISYNKIRPIKYAPHKDAQIFSYYRNLISKKYEEKLKEYDLQKNVIAYRKISVTNNVTQGKCNIHFAKEAFDMIVNMKTCIVFTYDISSFFESLNHHFLKIKLLEVLNIKSLPPDYEAVYKALIQYNVAHFDDVYKAFGLIENKSGRKKYLHCPRYIFRKKKTLSSKKEYREKIVSQKLITKNTHQGIPQGASLSDVLANIYMLDFDKKMRILEKKVNGYYRRYSDDILWIAPTKEVAEKIKSMIHQSVEELCGGTLKISSGKTTETEFFKTPCGLFSKGQKFQYLGFRFDGKKAFFRDSTISRYKRNTIKKIRTFIKMAEYKYKKLNRSQSLNSLIDRSKIFHKVFYRNKKFKDNSEKIQGNFINYFERAKKIFNTCRNRQYSLYDKQLSNHKHWIHKQIEKEIKNIQNRSLNLS